MASRWGRLLAAAALTFGVFWAGSASAISFYAEILTNDSLIWPSSFRDVRASATLTVDFDPITFDWTGMGGPPGLGTGDVTAAQPLEYAHLYDPTPDSASVLQAWLFISVVDDQLGDPPETAEIELDDSFWQTGQATLNLFFGEITALGLISTDGDTVDVRVSSVGGSPGDFTVLASALKVKFQPVPEPATALLLAFGMLALGVRRSARRAAPVRPPTPSQSRRRAA